MWHTDLHGKEYLPIIILETRNYEFRVSESGHRIAKNDVLVCPGWKFYVTKEPLYLEDLFENYLWINVMEMSGGWYPGDIVKVGQELKILGNRLIK